MKQASRTLAILSFAGSLACDSETPTTPDALTAPVIRSPASGEVIGTNPPTLTVGNASGGVGDPTYTFEVAMDDAFESILASVEGVGQGEGGTTSWQVPSPLSGAAADDSGRSTYYWRARASATGEVSPWSSIGNFDVQEGFRRSGPSSTGLLVYDPLTTGSSVGVVSGGLFEERGWRTTSATSFIRYEVPTIASGFLELEVTNLMEPNPHSDKRMLMIMWDPSRGDYTTNPFRVHLQKLDRRTVNFGDLRLRWISRRQERNIYHDRTDWRPGRIYHFRMEWGDFPNIDTQWVRVLLDGEEILTANYDNLYQPSPHWIELGGAPRNETLEQAVFSNVRIGRR